MIIIKSLKKIFYLFFILNLAYFSTFHAVNHVSDSQESSSGQLDGLTQEDLNDLLFEEINQENIDYEEVRKLLDQGADVNAKDDDCETLLHWASFRQDRVLIHLLLERGARIDIRNNGNSTPLMDADMLGYEGIRDLLILVSKFDISILQSKPLQAILQILIQSQNQRLPRTMIGRLLIYSNCDLVIELMRLCPKASKSILNELFFAKKFRSICENYRNRSKLNLKKMNYLIEQILDSSFTSEVKRELQMIARGHTCFTKIDQKILLNFSDITIITKL